MSKRFSVLGPLDVEKQEIFAIELCNFFSPLRYKESCKIIGKTPDSGTIRPLTLGNFLTYIQKARQIDGFKYQYHIRNIIQRFVDKSILVFSGSGQGSPPFSNSYYAQFELTEKQKGNTLWLGKVLGEQFLMEKYKPFIIRFEGSYSNNESGTGSGILINPNTILTCRHNLEDLKEYGCYIDEHKLDVSHDAYHEKNDIGIVKLKTNLTAPYFPYFGEPHILDETLTMGYPPLRGMREAPLISQKGEINAKSKDWNNCDCITISSTVRPGNSGGPVISKEGYVVGIVTQYANSASSVSSDKNEFKDNNSIPFYNAISAISLRDILKEIDTEQELMFEDYS